MEVPVWETVVNSVKNSVEKAFKRQRKEEILESNLSGVKMQMILNDVG